jgi:hypothetical protein
MSTHGTLVVLEWTSAPFWPKIIDEHGQFRKFIIDHVYFQGDGLTKRGRGQNGIFGLQNLKFRLLALDDILHHIGVKLHYLGVMLHHLRVMLH